MPFTYFPRNDSIILIFCIFFIFQSSFPKFALAYSKFFRRRCRFRNGRSKESRLQLASSTVRYRASFRFEFSTREGQRFEAIEKRLDSKHLVETGSACLSESLAESIISKKAQDDLRHTFHA